MSKVILELTQGCKCNEARQEKRAISVSMFNHLDCSYVGKGRRTGFGPSSDSVLDTNKWTVTQGEIEVNGEYLELRGTSGTRGIISADNSYFGVNTEYRVSAYASEAYQNMQYIARLRSDAQNDGNIYCYGAGPSLMWCKSYEGGSYESDYSNFGNLLNMHQIVVFRDNGDYNKFYSGTYGTTLEITHSSHVTSDNLRVELSEGNDNGDIYFVDWCFVRHRIAEEPGHGLWGGEEALY